MNQNLQNLFFQILGAQAANDLTRLIDDYQAAELAPWLLSAIAPMEPELQADVTRLEKIESQARTDSDQAQAEASAAVAEASAAGAGVSLSLTERRLKKSRRASELRGTLAASVRDTQEARRRLQKLQNLLVELDKMTTPDAESIREIIRRNL